MKGGAVKPTIPLTFEKQLTELRSLLRCQVTAGLAEVSWPVAGATIRYPLEDSSLFDDWVSLDEVAQHTASFKVHRKFGYTVGKFSEFFVIPMYGTTGDTAIAHIGDTEITFGAVTPLGYHLFAGEHDEAYHPSWDEVRSLRILGESAETVERLLLTGTALLEMEANIKVDLFTFELPDFLEAAWGDARHSEHHDLHLARAVTDVEPLRLFKKGTSESDSASAFLQFYRVLEFYSIIQLQDTVSGLRWDRDLTPKEFLKKMTGIIDRDERSLLGLLLSKIADSGIGELARKKQLIETASIDGLCSAISAIYAFRNSVVHAKYDQRALITVESPLAASSLASEWATLCKLLAWRAMKTFGTGY
jgi:hypothetical protein